MGQLDGKVAIVTGAASGQGFEAAERFASEGAMVAACDRDEGGLARLADRLGARGFVSVVDLRDLDAVENFVDKSAERLGGIDVVYNNAGISIAARAEEHTSDLWDLMFDVNVKAQFFLIRKALPHLRASQAASVINVGSMAAQFGHDKMAAYCASKGAVVMLTKALAVELAGDGIRVNCLCPGLTRTPMVEDALRDLSEAEGRKLFESWVGRQLFRRAAEPSEIVDVAVFLASSASSFVTGEVISVSGGWQAW